MPKAVAVLTFLLSAGCSDRLGPTDREPLGTWAADFSVVGSSLILTLERIDGHVNGAGTYAIEAGRSGTLQISGSYAPPDITIDLLYDFGDNLTFSGSFDHTRRLRGILTNAQGQASPLTFTRR